MRFFFFHLHAFCWFASDVLSLASPFAASLNSIERFNSERPLQV